MVQKINVNGYEEFKKIVEQDCNKNSLLNIYFTGNKDDKGVSWCPDCVDAEPHVYKALEEHAQKESVFIVVNVGDRAFWKDLNNPFRKDINAQLSVIPTLLRWKSPVRLDGEQCCKQTLLEMFFTEDVE